MGKTPAKQSSHQHHDTSSEHSISGDRNDHSKARYHATYSFQPDEHSITQGMMPDELQARELKPGELGVLTVVATPIGNIEDISSRALSQLKSADIIACEDTRVTKSLLSELGLTAQRLISLHEHNEAARVDLIAGALNEGRQVALVSDAGTPLISDPGFVLVRALSEQGFVISTAPGCSALIAALSISGLATDRFYFAGFLPAKSSSRRKRLQALAELDATLIFYEAPHRIVQCADDLLSEYGAERECVLCRELTKPYEQVFRGNVAGLVEFLALDSNYRRGEMVLMLEAAKTEMQLAISDESKAWLKLLQAERVMKDKDLAKLAAQITALPKAAIYQFLVDNKASK